mmetsp:Transcript_3636/g.6922  ORF Transcript_3636/g.6922 Transcript_3636/m.6922 type:complete len:88 (-) Transcript_3636:600-863(-)
MPRRDVGELAGLMPKAPLANRGEVSDGDLPGPSLAMPSWRNHSCDRKVSVERLCDKLNLWGGAVLSSLLCVIATCEPRPNLDLAWSI